jgi:hypothetical protein
MRIVFQKISSMLHLKNSVSGSKLLFVFLVKFLSISRSVVSKNSIPLFPAKLIKLDMKYFLYTNYLLNKVLIC